VEPPVTITSTLTPQEAARTHWDVIILGAGLAGTSAAIASSSQSPQLKTLLIDKARFPRDKVCGGCLNQSAMAALQQLGFDNLPARLGALSTSRMTLASHGHQATLSLPSGIAVSRRTLDAALITHAIERGASFLSGHAARVISPGHVTLSDVTLNASVIVLGDGLKGTANPASTEQDNLQTHPDSRLGVGALLPANASVHFEPGVIHMACHPQGYVGLVRVEHSLLNIAAALDPAFIQSSGGVAPAVSAVLTHAGLDVPDLKHADWNAVHGLTRSRGRLWQTRMLIAGDAAGYVEPFTGEGMAWALWGGLALLPHIQAAKSGWSDAIGQAWQRDHAARVASRQHLCRALAWSLRRPRLVRAAVQALRAFPTLANPFTRRINSPSIPQGGAL
jgi:menaquinone-9 beta-reductase